MNAQLLSTAAAALPDTVQARALAESFGLAPDAVTRYSPTAQADAEEGVLLVEGPIVDSDMGDIADWFFSGSYASPDKVRARLAELDGDILVKVNSPGGSVPAASSIGEMLLGWEGKVSCRITGMAASAGAIVTLHADAPEIAPMGLVMIHQAMILTYGNEDDIRKDADLLGKIDAAQVSMLVERRGMDEQAARAALQAETWWNAAEAVDAGFAASVFEGASEPEAPKEKYRKNASALSATAARRANLAAAMLRAGRQETL